MQYVIEFIESKTIDTTRGPSLKATATLKDTAGVTTEGVTIWGSFPEFSGLMMGHMVEGEIEVKKNGQYTNKTLNPIRKPLDPPQFIKNKQAGITQAMEKKETSIKNFQENKEWSIIQAASFRDATLLTVAEAQKGDIEFEFVWLRWRQWLAQNWELDQKNFKQPF